MESNNKGSSTEDDEFGFTRRDVQVLKKVLNVENDERPAASTSVGNNGVSTPIVALSSNTTVARGNDDSRRRSAASTAASSASVVSSTPDIPNVVEYHLKVQPKPSSSSPSSSKTTITRRENEPKYENTRDMKKEKNPQTTLSVEKKKELVTKLSRLSIDNNVFEGSTELPQVFQVKYLGSHDARGLWGIKHTRRPVDNMVATAKSLSSNRMLPLIRLAVSQEGVTILPIEKRKTPSDTVKMYSIETISYGVQDLVYTRVFSMIVVRDTENFRKSSPFECHGFVCESKYHARQLTFALATAFEIYSRTVKARDKLIELTGNNNKKRFAIDLRSPEEIEADLTLDSEA